LSVADGASTGYLRLFSARSCWNGRGVGDSARYELVLWEKRGQFEIGTNFRAWAFQIARYKLLQHQARRQRACVCFSDALVDDWCSRSRRLAKRLPDGCDDLRRCSPRCPLGTGTDRPALCAAGNVPKRRRGGRRPVRWVYKAISRIRKSLWSVSCGNGRWHWLSQWAREGEGQMSDSSLPLDETAGPGRRRLATARSSRPRPRG